MPRLGYKTWLVGWHAVVVAVILGAIGVGLDWTLRRVVVAQFDAALLHVAQTEAGEIADEGEPLRPHLLPSESRRLLATFNPVVQLWDDEGHVTMLVGAARALPLPASLVDRVARGEVVFQTLLDARGHALRVVATPASNGARHYMVVAAQPLSDVDRLLGRIRLLLIGTFGAVLFAIVLTDVVLARRALQPIHAIVRQVRRMRHANLSERLPQPGRHHELGVLVDTLNELLTRLEESFRTQQRFTADAAHELRSPLTRLWTEIEVTLRRSRTTADYRSVLALCLEEIRRVARLTEDLLALARLDAGEGRETPSASVALAPIVESVVERFLPPAAGRGIALVLEPPPSLTVHVVPGLLEIVIANVLDNAIKFSPSGAQVAVRVARDGDAAVVTVRDGGPGIPPEELPRIFERFFRGRAPRATEVPGVGLGLAIARTLAERQGASLTVESQPGSGATVSIHLPIADAVDAEAALGSAPHR